MPTSSQPAASKSIWDEADDDELRIQSLPTKPCPKCGQAMSSEAVVCVACGYNRRTGESFTLQRGPEKACPRTAGGLRALYDRFMLGAQNGSVFELRITIVLLFIGFGLSFYGCNEKKLADASSQTPETVSLNDLIKRGPDGNPNIVLTNYLLCEDMVFEARKKVGNDSKGDWTAVWVPIFSDDAVTDLATAEQAMRNPQALIHSKRVRNVNELDKLQSPQLRGMVTNRIASLDSESKKLLSERYPLINFDRCLIIDEGREPKSSEAISFFIGAGALLFVAGVGMLGKRFLCLG